MANGQGRGRTGRTTGRGAPRAERRGNPGPGGGAHGPSAPRSRCAPLVDLHASQLQAALGYRARRLLAELERDAADATLAHALTPTSAALLRWWFSATVTRTREDNFHPGQREAILHVVLAHEVFGECDAARLFHLVQRTGPIPAPEPSPATPPSRDMRLALRCAPGTGLRWVVQALLVWQWANHMAARAAGREDARFSDRFTVLVPPARQAEWETALLGPVAVAGLRTVGDAGMLRRMRLFLPPALRAPFRFWLMMQACAADALRVLADDAGGALATLVAGRGPRLASGLPAPVFSGPGAVPLLAPRSLRLTWRHDRALPPSTAASRDDARPVPADAAPARDDACVSDFDATRAIRYGVAKLPVLQCAPARHRLRAGTGPRDGRSGARPALRRDHDAQLRLGLRALAHRHAAFASLDPARAPRMRVLCETPGQQRAARARLLALGVAATDIVLDDMPRAMRPGPIDTGTTGNGTIGTPPIGMPRIDLGRIGIARLSAPPAPDPRVCVLVVLRDTVPGAPDTPDITALASACVPALWPEPELARLRAGNRERAAFGQPPDTLLDVLTVVEHRDALPLYAPWRRMGLASLDPRPPEAIPPTGDVLVATLREDAARFEIALPPTCADIAALESPERLSALPRRLHRASRSLPVRKSIHAVAGWHEDDSGLRRGFIEAAEHDPRIESHCLLDPRRHACRHRDTLLALGMDGRGRVDALARTATHVYLIEFLPDRPAGVAPYHDGGERALRLWRRRTNTLPPEQRDDRLWRRVRLQAPLFWSCKRHGVPLSALLAALAGTRSLVAAASGHASPAGAPPL